MLDALFVPGLQAYYESRWVDIDVSPNTMDELEFRGNIDTVVHERIFLKNVIRGKANLLSYIDSVNKRHFYLEIGDSIHELNIYYSIDRNSESTEGARLMEQDAYKTQLMNALGSRQGISRKIAGSTYDAGSLARVLQYYNESGKDTLNDIEAEEHPVTFHPGLFLGYGSNTLHLSGNGYTGNTAYGQFLIGLSVEFISSKLNNQFSFLLSGDLLRYNSSFSLQNLNSSGEASNDYFDISYINFDLLPRYRLPIDKQDWFFLESGLGISFEDKLYKDESDGYYPDDPSIPVQKQPAMGYSDGMIQVLGGFGILIGNHLSFEIRLSFGTGATSDLYYSSRSNTAGFMMGFLY